MSTPTYDIPWMVQFWLIFSMPGFIVAAGSIMVMRRRAPPNTMKFRYSILELLTGILILGIGFTAFPSHGLLLSALLSTYLMQGALVGWFYERYNPREAPFSGPRSAMRMLSFSIGWLVAWSILFVIFFSVR